MATRAAAQPATDEDEIVMPTIPMSYEAYLAWYDGDAGRRGEWVDGEVIPFMTTSTRHARWVSFLLRLLGDYMELTGSGEVMGQSYELRTRETAAREPDILVVLNEHRDRFEAMRLAGAADVVVEIISPDSVTRDRRDKFAEYAVAGVPEYWLVDPRPGHERLDLFVLDVTGAYRPVEVDAHGRLPSAVLPGVWADPAWLHGEELPSVVRLAMRMARVETITP